MSRCISPLRSAFDYNGNVTKNQLTAVGSILFDCRRCLPCRLNGAREKAIRCVHEASTHEDNIFLTLTYDDEHLESPWLIYEHFQTFMLNLRSRLYYEFNGSKTISFMVTGEYGDKNKRPHWHAIVFNFSPDDKKRKYSTELGEQVYSSDFISELWSRGAAEFGSVTMESAGYVARYAAKKLAHGRDQDHPFQPIHKTSSRNAIGKSWIEKNCRHVFENGFVVLPNGSTAKIPRYYVDWCKSHRPDLYRYYVTEVLPPFIEKARAEIAAAQWDFADIIRKRKSPLRPLKPVKVSEIILQSKFKVLQERNKL